MARGYATLEECDGHVVNDAGPNADEIGYAFKIGGDEIDLSLTEIMEMKEAIAVAMRKGEV